MRYAEGENAILVGVFGTTGLNVEINIVALESHNEIELLTAKCIEIPSMPGVYSWNTENIKEGAITKKTNCIYRMINVDSPLEARYGKVVLEDENQAEISLTEVMAKLASLQDDLFKLFVLGA